MTTPIDSNSKITRSNLTDKVQLIHDVLTLPPAFASQTLALETLSELITYVTTLEYALDKAANLVDLLNTCSIVPTPKTPTSPSGASPIPYIIPNPWKAVTND